MKYVQKQALILLTVTGCALCVIHYLIKKESSHTSTVALAVIRNTKVDLVTNGTRVGIANETKIDISTIVNDIRKNLPIKHLIRFYKQDTPIDDMEFLQRQSKKAMESTMELAPQKRCAVIGNSGIIVNSGCGEEINSHDFVIRCNAPEITDHTRDVGYKTNVTIVYQTAALDIYNFSTDYPMPAKFRQRMEHMNNSMIWYPGVFSSRIRTVWKTNLKYLKSTLHISSTFAFTTYTTLTEIVKRTFHLRSSPTAGLRSVVAALSLCDDVSVYGFYPYPEDTHGDRVPYHYFGKYRNYTIGGFKLGHDLNDEFDLLKSMHDRNILKFVYDKCI